MQVESTFEVVSHAPDATGTGEASNPPSASVSLDVALVKSNFTFACNDPLLVGLVFDALFCEQVKIDDMTASGQRLTVRTTLHAGAFDRASAICHQVAVAHLDHDTGVDLGYRDIEILDQSDDYLADCRIIPSVEASMPLGWRLMALVRQPDSDDWQASAAGSPCAPAARVAAS